MIGNASKYEFESTNHNKPNTEEFNIYLFTLLKMVYFERIPSTS